MTRLRHLRVGNINWIFIYRKFSHPNTQLVVPCVLPPVNNYNASLAATATSRRFGSIYDLRFTIESDRNRQAIGNMR